MSSTIQSLKVTYNPINDSNTFTRGDIGTGQVELEVLKECEVQGLSIKFKGKAEVLWTERHGKTTVVYHSKNKYFSTRKFFIQEEDHNDSDSEALLNSDGLLNVTNGETYSRFLTPGRHVYPFTFQFPMQTIPSSFQGSVGKVVYLLEACLSRSMRMNKKDDTKLNYVSQDGIDTLSELTISQHESKDKKLKLFNSGTVSMDVDIEKTGFYQGEGIKVMATIQNNSTREIRPKYCVYSKHSFFAKGKRRLHTHDLLKEVGEAIPPSTSVKVTQIIKIPPDTEPSIHNCQILKAEHRIRVYLDVKYAFDPEIKFPIVILRAHQYARPPPGASNFQDFGNASAPYYNPTPLPPALQPAQNMPQYPTPVPQPIPQPLSQPLSRPMFQPLSQPMFQPLSHPLSQPMSQPVPLPLSQPMFQPVPLPLSQPMFQPVPLPLSQPMFQPVHQAPAVPVNPADPPPAYSEIGMYPTLHQYGTHQHQQ